MSRFVGINHPPDTLPLGISFLKTSACPPGPPRSSRLIESKKISDVRAFRFCVPVWASIVATSPFCHAGMARFLSRAWGELPVSSSPPYLRIRDPPRSAFTRPRPNKRTHPIALLDLDCQLYVAFHFLIRALLLFF